MVARTGRKASELFTRQKEKTDFVNSSNVFQ